MSNLSLLINGQFRAQRPAGVHRYAREIISQFEEQNVSYGWVQPPARLRSDAARQLWMQTIMPVKIPNDTLLWSPTNIGPAWCENQVLTLHDIADQLHSEWFDSKYVAWRQFILPKLIRRVRGIVTVSRFSRDTIIDYYPQSEGKIEVIYNGVRHAHFYPRGEEEIELLRQKFNLQKPFILTVGSLDERKNIRGLIDAWRTLPKMVKKKYDLVITGESARKFVFTLDKPLDESIRFMGYVKDDYLPVLYSAAAIFTYPSLFEGFGLPVLEAMACGTAVITSDSTSLKELAGDKALTVDPREPDGIAAAIKELIESDKLRRQYAAEGQQYAKTFSWDKTAVKTKKILEKAVE